MRLMSIQQEQKNKKYNKMITNYNEVKEEKKNNLNNQVFSRRASWNSRRRHDYKYVTSVF